MPQLYTCANGDGGGDDVEDEDDDNKNSLRENVQEFARLVKSCDVEFETYLLHVLGQQLDAILNETNSIKLAIGGGGKSTAGTGAAANNSTSATTHVAGNSNSANSCLLYDCETYTEEQLLEFLTKLWK